MLQNGQKLRRIPRRRKKLLVSASFLDPTIKSQLRPSIERQIKHKLKDLCFNQGKTRESHQVWLDITNSFLQTSEDLERSAINRPITPVQPPRTKPSIIEPSKPMFILISEKEVPDQKEPKYLPYYKSDSLPQLQPHQRHASFENFKKFVPLPVKKFNGNIIPDLSTYAPLKSTHKSLRKFKF